MVKGVGVPTDTAAAKSANCKAGDGTAELRQLLPNEGALPEPLPSGCDNGRDRLTKFVDLDLDFTGQVLMRKNAGALASELR